MPPPNAACIVSRCNSTYGVNCRPLLTWCCQQHLDRDRHRAHPHPKPSIITTATKRIGVDSCPSDSPEAASSSVSVFHSSTSTTIAPALHLEPRALLALDVEFTHVLLPDGTQVSHATWVCLVDRFGGVPFKTYCALPYHNDLGGAFSGTRSGHVPRASRVIGGVQPDLLCTAPPLAAVRQQMLTLLRQCGCRTLVGHGLTKDLRALGIEPTAGLEGSLGVRLYDTMSYGKFQGRSGGTRRGAARPLAELAREFLGGRVIQDGTTGHDPQEDARAVIDLYVRHVDLSYMVEYETAKLLRSMPGRSPGDDGEDDDGSEGGGLQDVMEIQSEDVDEVRGAPNELTDCDGVGVKNGKEVVGDGGDRA